MDFEARGSADRANIISACLALVQTFDLNCAIIVDFVEVYGGPWTAGASPEGADVETISSILIRVRTNPFMMLGIITRWSVPDYVLTILITMVIRDIFLIIAAPLLSVIVVF